MLASLVALHCPMSKYAFVYLYLLVYLIFSVCPRKPPILFAITIYIWVRWRCVVVWRLHTRLLLVLQFHIDTMFCVCMVLGHSVTAWWATAFITYIWNWITWKRLSAMMSTIHLCTCVTTSIELTHVVCARARKMERNDCYWKSTQSFQYENYV